VTACEVTVTGDDTRVLIALSGEIDLTNRDRVADAVIAAISNETTSAVIDTSAIAYLDSTGLRFLFALAERLDRLQVGLTIVAPAGSIARKVIDLTGLGHVATISDT
jgi:stage II sporulation protein AA (anti-sigma F factor antagonist)